MQVFEGRDLPKVSCGAHSTVERPSAPAHRPVSDGRRLHSPGDIAEEPSSIAVVACASGFCQRRLRAIAFSTPFINMTNWYPDSSTVALR